MYSKGKTNLEISPRSSDLLTNIYNCIPDGLMQIFQYFLYTLKNIKKLLIDARTKNGVRIY